MKVVLKLTKTSEYTDVVLPLLEQGKSSELKTYILAKANLPGRMANITLVHTIASLLAKDKILAVTWYPVFKKWWRLEADGNDAETVVLLVALESFGSIYQHQSAKIQLEIQQLLEEALSDQRWRMREIVTESYKWLGRCNYEKLRELFEEILTHNLTPLTMRGTLATVAHPEILQSKEQVDFAQKLMEMAFAYYSASGSEFSKVEQDILRKGLAFAPSVIVSKNPEVGFAFFAQLIENQDKNINRIVKENLQKKRLAGVYPSEVEHLLFKITTK